MGQVTARAYLSDTAQKGTSPLGLIPKNQS